MSEQKRRRWIVKNSEGLLKGPYTTEQVLERIGEGRFGGDELISEYPGANWYPISQDPQFYDRLLEVLSNQPEREQLRSTRTRLKNSQATEENPSPTIKGPSTTVLPDEEIEPSIEVAPHLGASAEKQAWRSQPAQGDPTQVGTIPKSPQPGAGKQKKAKKSKSDRRNKTRKPGGNSDDIEMVDVKKRVKSESRRSAIFPAILALIIIGAGFMLMSTPEPVQEERVHLLAPGSGASSLSSEQVRDKISRGVGEYLRDSFSGYMRAQNELVQVLESDSRNAEVMGLLCLAYYELWPFTFQDSEDLRAISTVTQLASAVDGAGMHSSSCKVVDLILKGRLDEAKSLSSTVLETYGDRAAPPIPFYYFMAILSEASGDYQTAVGYLTSAQKLWPQWIRAFVYQAQVYTKLENYTEAARIYRAVLESSPNHEVAKIELGLLEARHFRNIQRGLELIKSAVDSKERVSRRILSKGYLGLAEIYLQQGNSAEALKTSQRAYELDSTNSTAKNLVVQLGGTKALSKAQFKSYQLIAEGDQFFREGDCNTAQAHFKAAFEVDNKSGLAAMKAAECLWRLSLTTEAIEWLNKAIRADPKLIEAYVILADYYSQRFNFVAAAQVLISAQAVAPKSYEVYRGFAMVELRRQNDQAAVEYARRALSIYDTDVESHVILAEALTNLGDYTTAFSHANRARELDVNHRRAQVIYGRSLAGVQGSDAALDYFKELVKLFPVVTEYRLGLGRQYFFEQRYGDAERVFAELANIDPKSKEAYLEWGRTLKAQRKNDQALTAFEQAAILDPSDAGPLFEIGLLYLDAGKPDQAQVQLQRVIRINKLYPLVHYYLGRAALALGDSALALREAKEERNVNPSLAEPYLLAAEVYAMQQQYSLCVSEFQKAIKLRPRSAEIYIKIANCYRRSDQLDLAISMLNQAAVIESGLPEIYRELGMIYEIKGDVLEAGKAYNQYLVLNPNAPDADTIRRRFLGKMGVGDGGN